MGVQDDYLLTDYPRDEAELLRARKLTRKTISTLLVAIEGTLEIAYTLPRGSERVDRSWSTSAMVLHALAVAAGAMNGKAARVIFPWDVDGGLFAESLPGLDPLGRAGKSDEEKERQRLEKINGLVSARCRHLAADKQAREGEFHSDSWGDWDPLTLSYLYELYKAIPVEAPEFGGRLATAIGKSLDRLKSTPVVPLAFDPDLKKAQFTDHAFSLLRIVHLDKMAGNPKAAAHAISRDPVSSLTDRMHRQLSLSGIGGKAFDAGELVYPLETLLQLNSTWYDRDLVEGVFRVLEATQTESAYWRPFSPISVTKQGLVLLPQSIEVAMSLLRICNLIEARSESKPFSEHIDLFGRYTHWLFDRALTLRYSPDGGEILNKDAPTTEVFGWESEHTHQRDVIHTWLTSQVLLFALGYSAKLREHIARSALSAARLTISLPQTGERTVTESDGAVPPPPKFDHGALAKFLASEPVSTKFGENPTAYKQLTQGLDLRNRHDHRRWAAVILYGPPGTGKSSTAREIAKILGWRMVRVTPGDFVTTGGEGLEARAQVIFKTLGLLSKHVVFFDEMDQLMLDRESELYEEQSDVFKLVTPSLLTKMADLVENRDNIYLIATNYFDRIDRAVSRPGRIDACIPILPPDMGARRYFLGSQIDSAYSPELTLPEDSDEMVVPPWTAGGKAVNTLISNTALFTFAELKALVNDAKAMAKEASPKKVCSVEEIVAACLKLLEDGREPTINVDGYQSRVDLHGDSSSRVRGRSEQLQQRALLECALVAFLRTEENLKAGGEEGSVEALRQAWAKKLWWLLAALRKPNGVEALKNKVPMTIQELVRMPAPGSSGVSGAEELGAEDVTIIRAFQRALELAVPPLLEGA